YHAARRGTVVPVYILDDPAEGRPLGSASRWWLHHSLEALRNDLPGLILLKGDALSQLTGLIAKTGADALYWNRCYEPAAIERDRTIKAALAAQGLDVRSFNGALMHEPWEISTGAGGPFKVYTPFWRAALKRDVEPPLPRACIKGPSLEMLGDDLCDWNLLPRAPDWAAGWREIWQPGEAGAVARLGDFIENGLDGYASLRDRPDRNNVSRLSAHLHFGEISPRQIWSALGFQADREPRLEHDRAKFLSEIGWREFSHHLLYHFPEMPTANWRPAFDAYPWRDSAHDLAAWQRGLTGYPFVDAGMRELWHTGVMHNRVRMIAASFLVKHLRIHWRAGEAWFWDTLVDADLANNVAGWQWVAGSGADASPYFRIFNPVTQGRRFDPDGAYVRRWCPELAGLGNDVIHAPFDAPAESLRKAGVELGATYPGPLVDHASARKDALKGYESVKNAAQTA
ncbi:MAG: deoxyribodipyrimidine photo-lyase, partial [Rhizobiales bacterium]|nr:deoxyribodipyrimidine photo-lyase [Hyphomicrobiales bacterium]